MTGPVWTKIKVLDVERQEIQNRITARAHMHFKGVTLSPEQKREAYKDALRYIEIEDQQWVLLGIKKPQGDDNFPG